MMGGAPKTKQKINPTRVYLLPILRLLLGFNTQITHDWCRLTVASFYGAFL